MLRESYLALVFFGLLAYFNAIQHPFVHDDVVFILKNPHISELDHWEEAFKLSSVSDGLNTYYRPVLEILYRLEYHFFGPHPSGFHFFNCLVHVMNGLLLFCLLQKLSLPMRVSWVIALIFLIHPVQTETVSCISGVSNLWMSLWILLALIFYLNKCFLLSVLLFVIAFLSKEQGILFFPLVLVIDLYRGIINFRSWIYVGIASSALLFLRQGVTGASLFKDIMVSPGELYLRLAAIPRVLGMDLRLIFFPNDLHYYRNTDILLSNTISWISAGIFLFAIFYILNRWISLRPIVILGLGWFLATLLPMLNIVPLINEYSFIFTPEHFLYLPLVGVLILVVLAADHLIKRFRKVLLGIVVGSCLVLTWHQNTFWGSEIKLFERMLRFEPDFGRGHLLLAKAYYFNGQPDRAEGHFRKAFLIMSGYGQKATNMTARNFYLKYIREILFSWAQNDCARGLWSKGLDKYKRVEAIDAKDPSLFNNMAFIYFHMNDPKDAYLSLEQALRIDPNFIQARRNLNLLSLPH